VAIGGFGERSEALAVIAEARAAAG
jgi:hypothetical protein